MQMMTIAGSSSSRRPILALILAVLLLLGPARADLGAAQPHQDLLRLVPEDMGFCLLIQDLREHVRSFLGSPFIKQAALSQFGKDLLASPEAGQIQSLNSFLQEKFQISMLGLTEDVLGTALVLAYKPELPAGKEGEQELLLLHAPKPDVLNRLLDRLTACQKASGNWKEVREHRIQNRKYLEAVGPSSSTFLFQEGPLLAVSNQEKIVQQLIARLDRGNSPESVYEKHFALPAPGRLASLWINPRAFQPLLEQQASQAKGAQAVALNAFLRYWQALDGIALYLTHTESLEMTLALRGRVADLGLAGRSLLSAQQSETSDLAQRWPDNALLSLTCQTNIAGLVEAFCEFLDASSRQVLRTALDKSVGAVLGADFTAQVLPALGPDWGVCLLAPPQGQPDWFPYLVAALRVRSSEADGGVLVQVRNAVHSLATLAVFAHNQGNKGSTVLRTQVRNGIEVWYLSNEREFPPGFSPAFACRDGYLVLASSPAALEQFGNRRPGAARESGSERSLLKISFEPLARYLLDRKQALTRHNASRRGIKPEEAMKDLERLTSLLGLFEKLNLSRSPSDTGAAWVLRVQGKAPLR